MSEFEDLKVNEDLDSFGANSSLSKCKNGFHQCKGNRGSRTIEVTSLLPSKEIPPKIITKIKQQKASGNFRTIAGRPWWVSFYDIEELKKSGLI